jgi:asparagine synthetase B (glutamine-hydrolysing)
VNLHALISIRGIEIAAHPISGPSPQPTPEANEGSASFSIRAPSGSWRADINLHQSVNRQAIAEAARSGELRMVIGDADEARASSASEICANATVVRIDLRDSTVEISTSLTGLPPVFILQDGAQRIVGSPFIPNAASGSLRPDPDGIADCLRWGHPLDGRTLFADLRIAPSNGSIRVCANGELREETRGWPSSEDLAGLSAEELVSQQVSVFLDAAGRFDTSRAFVSLSGGLDSRASVVGLLAHNRRPACVTMAGSHKNLDAQLARAFCESHGLQHSIVLLDDAFQARLPDLVADAAHASGGVACLSQSADLFMYERLSNEFASRISGNLGNQVGRGGVESLAAYQPSPEMFSSQIRQKLEARSVAPWFIPRLAGKNYAEVLFGQEVPFWSMANYVVGSTRAQQLTPYADRRLLLISQELFSRNYDFRRPTRKLMRRRDLRHRVFGTPLEASFQRRLLASHDRIGQRVPLNWGWRAAGGGSIVWRLSAMASATDAAMIKLARDSGIASPIAMWLSAKLEHRSALVDWRQMLRHSLRELVFDTFRSQAVAHSEVFDPRVAESTLQKHFNGESDHHLTIARGFEIALGIYARSSTPRH